MAATRLPPGLRLAMDYNEELDRGLLDAAMDGGPGKQRPRYSRALKARQLKLVALSLAAKQAFDRWWDEDLKGGCEWFDFVDPLTSKSQEGRFIMPKLKWHMVSRGVWESSVTIQTLGID